MHKAEHEKQNKDKKHGGHEFFPRLLKKQVKLQLINGQVLEGVLNEFNNYEILLKSGDREVVVFKHALVTLEEVKV